MAERTATGGDIAGSGLGSAEIDAIKGFFIVLVVVGHNTLVLAVLPRASEVLYNFHIFAFLLLPFLLASHPLGRGFAADRAVRYLVPHAAFYGLAAALFAASRLPEVTLAESAGRALAGLALGTPGAIERGCGLRAFWFLPALFTLALLRAAMARSHAAAAGLAAPGWRSTSPPARSAGTSRSGCSSASRSRCSCCRSASRRPGPGACASGSGAPR